MKKFLLVLGLSTLVVVQMSSAEASDFKTSQCSKNPAAILVEINGAGADEIYSHIAKSLNVSTAELGGVVSNDMFCRPISSSAISCSFLMVGAKNIPFPQVDARFSQEKSLVCN